LRRIQANHHWEILSLNRHLPLARNKAAQTPPRIEKALIGDLNRNLFLP
jgi:hypothetical protein